MARTRRGGYLKRPKKRVIPLAIRLQTGADLHRAKLQAIKDWWIDAVYECAKLGLDPIPIRHSDAAALMQDLTPFEAAMRAKTAASTALNPGARTKEAGQSAGRGVEFVEENGDGPGVRMRKTRA
jgi:hypothetical protein